MVMTVVTPISFKLFSVELADDKPLYLVYEYICKHKSCIVLSFALVCAFMNSSIIKFLEALLH